jgi:hypothetical protein
MSDIFAAICGVALLVYIVGIPIYTIQEHKKRIRAVLESRGAENISIEYLPLTLDRTNYSYEVQYHEPGGRYHMTKCKMSMIKPAIYWMDEDLS